MGEFIENKGYLVIICSTEQSFKKETCSIPYLKERNGRVLVLNMIYPL